MKAAKRKILLRDMGTAFKVLRINDQRKILVIALIQITMGLLDLFGVVALGGLGALAVQGVEARASGNKVNVLLNFLHLQNFNFQAQVAMLGALAAVILLIKTVLSIYFTRRTFFFLSYKSAEISSLLVSKVLNMDLAELQKRSSQEILYNISNGVNSILNGIVATVVTILSDSALVLILSIGLFVLDPVVAIFTLVIFTTLAVLLYRLLNVRAQEIGIKNNLLTVKSNEKIIEALNSYRETVVRDRRAFYSVQVERIRYSLAELLAELNFQPYIGKYIIETFTVISSLILAGYEFSAKNAVHAVSILVVFAAASSRIAPAALRLQQGFVSIRNSLGSAESTLQMMAELDYNPNDSIEKYQRTKNFDFDDFSPRIELHDLSFTYEGNANFALKEVNLEIEPGSSLAIVGPSGSGKTTLVDLILGILTPSLGTIEISGYPPRTASTRWSGSMSYVPQNVVIAPGTVRENVGLGYEKELSTDRRVNGALSLAQLQEVVAKLPQGIDTVVGENGTKLSGGQRQRLGIARALFTSPKILVLDEATSALDAQTELELTESIAGLKGQMTLVIIAHRLSTVRMVDQLIYIERGKIIATGTFDEVRSRVPQFDSQAKLMGL